jgi:hypothetical protein
MEEESFEFSNRVGQVWAFDFLAINAAITVVIESDAYFFVHRVLVLSTVDGKGTHIYEEPGGEMVLGELGSWDGRDDRRRIL